MEPASSLEDAYYDTLGVFAEDVTLDVAQAAARYVERAGRAGAHRQLANRLLETPEPQRHRVKALVTGQTGTGKSMELARLAADPAVGGAYETLFLDAKERLNLARAVDVRYLLVSIAEALATRIAHFAPSDVGNLGFGLTQVQVLREWIGVLTGRGNGQLPDPNQADWRSVLAQVGQVFVAVQPELVSGEGLRQRLAQSDVPTIKRLTEALASMLAEIVERPVLVVVDNLDKLRDPDSLRELFERHLDTLLGLSFPLVLTIPYHLRFGGLDAPVRRGLPVLTVPNLKVVTRTDRQTPLPSTVALLRAMLDGVVVPSLVSDEVVEKATLLSAGIPREFGRLVTRAVEVALEEKAPSVRGSHLEQAVARVRRDELQPLHADTRVTLHLELARARPDKLDADQRDLMGVLLIVEYTNDMQWYDVHPLLVPEYDERLGRRRTNLAAKLGRPPTDNELIDDIRDALDRLRR